MLPNGDITKDNQNWNKDVNKIEKHSQKVKVPS